MIEYEKIYYPESGKEISTLSFLPQDDITAHELSLLIPLIIPSHWKTQEHLLEQYKRLPEKCKRHITVNYK